MRGKSKSLQMRLLQDGFSENVVPQKAYEDTHKPETISTYTRFLQPRVSLLRPMARSTGTSGELGPRKAFRFFTVVTESHRFSLLVFP